MFQIPDCLPDEGQILPVFCDQLVIEFIRRAHGVVGKPVFAEISSHTQKPRLFVRFAFKAGRGLEKLHERVLQNLFGVCHVMKVGIGVAQNGVAVGVENLRGAGATSSCAAAFDVSFAAKSRAAAWKRAAPARNSCPQNGAGATTKAACIVFSLFAGVRSFRTPGCVSY